MAAKPLTDTVIRALKPRAAAYKLSDGGGLHIQVGPTGLKMWRLAYRLQGKQRCATLGAYPKLSLVLARKERERIKDKLRDGQDPAAPDTLTSEGPTFKSVSLAWHTAQRARALRTQVCFAIDIRTYSSCIRDYSLSDFVTLARLTSRYRQGCR